MSGSTCVHAAQHLHAQLVACAWPSTTSSSACMRSNKHLAGEWFHILHFSKRAVSGVIRSLAHLYNAFKAQSQSAGKQRATPRTTSEQVARTADGVAVGCGRADVLSARCPAAAAADLLALRAVVPAIQAHPLAQAAALPAANHAEGS